MPQIAPFRGIFYNKEAVSSLANVICPPYDVIDDRLQQELYARNPHNCVRLEKGRDYAGDSPLENRYTRAAATFEAWLNQGVLKQADSLAFYLHEHHFLHRGRHRVRHDLIARVRLAEWAEGSVKPHENTLSSAKTDRLKLLQHCTACFSPIFALYNDTGGSASSELAGLKEKGATHLLKLEYPGGELHQLSAVAHPDTIRHVEDLFQPLTFYIADGHHRYETAINYRKAVRTAPLSSRDENPTDFVMMALSSFSDPGVVTLPTHRVLRHLPPSSIEELQKKLGEVFELNAFPLEQLAANGNTENLVALLEREGKGRCAIGAVGLTQGVFLLMVARDSARLEGMVPPHPSAAYASLDVSILHHIILAGMLGFVEEEAPGDTITYTHSEAEAFRLVQQGEYQLAFVLNPIQATMVKAIADANDKMPIKSTYFYPKLPAGLVINSLRP